MTCAHAPSRARGRGESTVLCFPAVVPLALGQRPAPRGFWKVASVPSPPRACRVTRGRRRDRTPRKHYQCVRMRPAHRRRSRSRGLRMRSLGPGVADNGAVAGSTSVRRLSMIAPHVWRSRGPACPYTADRSSRRSMLLHACLVTGWHAMHLLGFSTTLGGHSQVRARGHQQNAP